VTDIAIQVEGLSKYYRIGKRGVQLTLKDSLAKSWRRAFNLFKFQNNRQDEFRDTNNSIWALSDVSFEVKKGEIIGIIGRNGAGKTTLLKILSRITVPTKGYAEINGRVGSLLEVGTGFHPELTGRENIYLNGAILGMKRAEIDHKFDNIVAFAEIEKFLDTPVKRYSSGMYVRLAFAVAAHLEPEILMVDEVLAVGDTAFQRKCVGKMGDVAKEGRTVLFVSHNMGAISALCESAILLDEGRITRIGLAPEIIAAYLSSLYEVSQCPLRGRTDRDGTGKAKFTSIYLADPDGRPLQQVLSGYECMLVLGYESTKPLRKPIFKITIYNSIGQPLVHFDNSLVGTLLQPFPKQGYVGCRFRRLPLSRGTYRLNVSIEDGGQLLDRVIGAYSFVVDDGDFYGTGRSIIGLKEVCLVDQEWLPLDEDALSIVAVP